VEPFTSMPGCGLDRAIKAGTAPILTAGSRIEARLAAVFFEGTKVQSISTEGQATGAARTSSAGSGG